MILFGGVSFSLVTNAAGLVPECNTKFVAATQDVKDQAGNVTTKGVKAHYDDPCNFDRLIDLINTVINFLLFEIATPLAALILCYIGFLMITSGGSSEKVTKVKHIVSNFLIGYVVALAAWIIINTILNAVGFKGNAYLH